MFSLLYKLHFITNALVLFFGVWGFVFVFFEVFLVSVKCFWICGDNKKSECIPLTCEYPNRWNTLWDRE